MKVAYRRLVFGVLLILMSGYTLYKAESLRRLLDKSLMFGHQWVPITLNLSGLVLIAFCDLIIGIIFVCTCTKTPLKKVEITLPLAVLGTQFVVGFMIGFGTGDLFDVTAEMMSIPLLLTLLGIAYGKGYHVLPFKGNQRWPWSSFIHVDEDKAADDIVKYKKLLDDGTINNDEFEAKKKQLLNL